MRKTLNVQNYVPAVRALGTGAVLAESRWDVSSYEVDAATDERGVEFLSVDGVRFALTYQQGAVRTACNIENPALLSGRAAEIGRKMWMSGTGVRAPSKHGAWIVQEPTR